MTIDKCTVKRFLFDVADHEMKIVKNDGLHRFVRFKKPDSGVFHFDLITWPYHLCITGDMGTFVFSRVEDMFAFFRGDLKSKHPINPSYWGEKMLSESRFGGFKEYDPDDFRRRVKNEFESFYEDSEDEKAKAKTWEELEDRVLTFADDKFLAFNVVNDFKSRDGFYFDMAEFGDCKSFTYHFIWCCYALVYGINLFDLKTEVGDFLCKQTGEVCELVEGATPGLRDGTYSGQCPANTFSLYAKTRIEFLKAVKSTCPNARGKS